MGAQASSDRARDQKIANDQYQLATIDDQLEDLFDEFDELETEFDNEVEKTNIQIQNDLKKQQQEHRQEYANILSERTAVQDRKFNNFNSVIQTGEDIVNLPINTTLGVFETTEQSIASLGIDFTEDLPYIIGGVVVATGVYYMYTQNN